MHQRLLAAVPRYLRRAEGSRSAAQLLQHRARRQDPMENHVLIHLDRPSTTNPPPPPPRRCTGGSAPSVWERRDRGEDYNVRLDKGDNPPGLTTHLRRTPFWHGAPCLIPRKTEQCRDVTLEASWPVRTASPQRCQTIRVPTKKQQHKTASSSLVATCLYYMVKSNLNTDGSLSRLQGHTSQSQQQQHWEEVELNPGQVGAFHLPNENSTRTW